MSANIRLICSDWRDWQDPLDDEGSNDVACARFSFEELIDKAVTSHTWQYKAVWGGQSRTKPWSEVCVGIASPEGRLAGSYNISRMTSASSASILNAVNSALTFGQHHAISPRLARFAASVWGHPTASRSNRKLLAQAACRVIHAQVWDYQPARRDQLYIELWDLDAKRLVEADDDLLEACAALMSCGNGSAAIELLAGRSPFAEDVPRVTRIY